MLSKCANPACSASFLYLHSGRLFHLEIAVEQDTAQLPATDHRTKLPVRRLEYFWLCPKCCAQMTLTTDRSGKLIIKHLAVANAS
jgi:hypothetical protein